MLKFNLQLFGGKGGTSIQTTTYEPTEYELQLQQIQVAYTEAISPNALWLNQRARVVLEGSIGEDENYNETFYSHFDTAKLRLDNAFANLENELSNLNTFAADISNIKALAGIEIDNWNEKVEPVSETIKKLFDKYGNVINAEINNSKSEKSRLVLLLKVFADKYPITNENIAKFLRNFFSGYDSSID